MKLNVKLKLIIFILLSLVITFVLIYVLMYPKIISYTENASKEISIKTTEKYSSLINNKILSNIGILNTLKISFENYNTKSADANQYYKNVLKNIITEKKDISSVWTLFGNEGENMQLRQYLRTESNIKYNNLKVTGNNFYNVLFQNEKIMPEDIGLYSHKSISAKDNNKLIFSLIVPVYNDYNLFGIIGFDFNFEDLLDGIEISEGNKINAMLGYNDKLYNLNSLSTIRNDEKLEIEKIFINSVKTGDKTFLFNNTNDINFLGNISPLIVNAKSVDLSLVVLTETNMSGNFLKQVNFRFIIISILCLAIIFFIIVFVLDKFLLRLKKTSMVLEAMAYGKISEIKDLDLSKNDEISNINKSINFINVNLDNTAGFIAEIASGNFDYEYIALTKEDNIGNSLVNLKQNLKKSQNEELNRKQEDERLNWATIGTAKFSEIIREHSDNLEELAYAIVSDLVNYIGANQGGLFVINEESEEKNVELLASYAYGRRKMLEKKIPMGVGLVGRCILEKETIFMTKIPEKYLNIVSGLGEENPATLLIVPLIFHEEVFGVVELASFKGIEKYKIDLVEQISESIASAISMVKINVRTAELLRETKIKSEQTASQEEEIRQNVEEMLASTDELNEKLEEMKNTNKVVNSIANIAHFDMNGRITDISEAYLKMLKKEKKEIIGQVQGSFSSEATNTDSFKNFWRELKKGKKMEFEQVINVENNIVKIKSVYFPLKNSEGKVYKVVSFALQN